MGDVEQSTSSVVGCFKASTRDGEKLQDEEDWQQFIAALITHGHILPSDAQTLRSLCTPPLSYQDLIGHLLKHFATEKTNDIEANIAFSFENCDDIERLLEFWRSREFDEEETGQLLHLLEQLCTESKDMLRELGAWRERVVGSHGEEDVATLFWDRLAPAAEPDITPHDYQRLFRPQIDALLRQSRVEAVCQHRFERTVVLAEELCCTRSVAYDINTDAPVMVVALALPCRDFAFLRSLYNNAEAHRQLALSPHFLSYRGCDDVSVPDQVLFFYEDVPRQSRLTRLVAKYGSVVHTTYLLRYWSYHILTAFQDILQKCTLRLQHPLSADAVYVADSGARVLIEDVQWLAERPISVLRDRTGEAPGAASTPTYHETLDALMVRWFSDVLYYLLTATESPFSEHKRMPPLPLEPALSGILRCCAAGGSRRPTLADLRRHPYFQGADAFSADDVRREFRAFVGRTG